MNKCSTCKYMAAKRDETYEMYTCVRIIHGNKDGNDITDKTMAAVLDGSGYSARLVVLPSFGCVLHESKV